MEHPGLTAALVSGVAGFLAVTACVVVDQVEGTSARTAAVPTVGRETAEPSAEFVVPFHAPAPPAALAGPEGGTGVLGPDDVVVPSPPVLTAPPRAVFRPA